jgi:Homeodomain-like domain
MDEFGWNPLFPAIEDENGVVIVGHRRLTMAEELGITPVIKKHTFGEGEAGDAARVEAALVSNLGPEKISIEDRKKIAAQLCGQGWKVDKIAEKLRVSQMTVYRYLEDLTPVKFPDKPKRGRPRKNPTDTDTTGAEPPASTTELNGTPDPAGTANQVATPEPQLGNTRTEDAVNPNGSDTDTVQGSENTVQGSEPSPTADPAEIERQHKVATQLMCSHLVTVAQMRGLGTARKYRADMAPRGQQVTMQTLLDAQTAIEEMIVIWKEEGFQ